MNIFHNEKKSEKRSHYDLVLFSVLVCSQRQSFTSDYISYKATSVIYSELHVAQIQ